MLIAVPSKNRAGKTTTDKLLRENCVFYVPFSEVHQYEELCHAKIIGVPNDVKGITATRNWIMQNTDEKHIVFIDDDVKFCGYMKLHERWSENIAIKDPEFWLIEFEKAFDLCMQLGYKIWGVSTESSPRSVYPYKPILTRTYVTASCMGIINDGEFYFDESYPVKEDYEICLRHIVEKGGILGIRYLIWENYHWDTDGGCKDYRTAKMEREMIKKLIKQFPGFISQASRRKNSYTITLNL